MSNNLGNLLEIIKVRSKILLIKNRSFIAFRAIVKVNGKIDYISVCKSENSTEEIYNLFLKAVNEDLKDEHTEVSAIVLNGMFEGYKALVIEIFFTPKYKYQVVIPYVLGNNDLIFGSQI